MSSLRVARVAPVRQRQQWTVAGQPRRARNQYLSELAAIKGLGCTAAVVDMGFPVLYQSFYQFNADPQDYQTMLNFYTQVVADLHADG
jgi:hypothetical protein